MKWLTTVRTLQREARVSSLVAGDHVHTYFVAEHKLHDAARLRHQLSTRPVASRLAYFLDHHDLHIDTALPAGRRLRTLLHMCRTQRLSHRALDLHYGSIDELVNQVDEVARGLAAAGGILFGPGTDIEYDPDDAQYEQYHAMDDGGLRRLWPPGKIPPPLDQAHNTALELAAFALLRPVLDKLKNQDLQGALAVVMSSAAVLKVTARLDPEMPRNILKKVLQNVDFIAAVQKMRSKLPVNMQSPFETLQS